MPQLIAYISPTLINDIVFMIRCQIKNLTTFMRLVSASI